MTFDEEIRQLLDVITEKQTLNQIARRSQLPRPKVISMLARLVRFGTVRMEYGNQQFLFSMA